MKHVSFFSLFYTDRINELPPWFVATIFFGTLGLGIGIYIYFTRHARSWRKGVFPPKLKANEDNFLEAFLALGARLILMNQESMRWKTQFMNEYFNRYFRMANYNFSDSLVFSLRYPIRTETVTDWIKKYWTTETMRSQLLYFLVGMAVSTKNLSSREMAFLKKVTSDLELPPQELQRIIAIYAAYYAGQEQREQQNTRSHAPKKTDQRAYFQQILGIDDSADQAAIKKAYRRLAKIHHPDNYASASLAQQKIAAEKFIQIQKAYEALLKEGVFK